MTLPVGAKRRKWIFLLAATAAIACGLQEDLQRVLAVQSALVAAHGGQFQVNLDNGSRLKVQVFNAGQAARERADSSEFLESVARTAYRAYEHRDSLTSLTVGYLEVSNTAVSSVEVSYPGRAWSGESLRALADSAVAMRVVPSLPPGA